MRPRKAILLVAANERTRSLWRLILQVRGFRVAAAGTVEQAQAALADPIHLVMAVEPSAASGICERIQAVAPGVPMLVVGHVRDNECATMLLPSNTSHAEIVERARVLAASKRGPRAGKIAARCCNLKK